MPTIVFCSPKGGAGKTTAALLLATQLVKIAPITGIDAGPNHPIKAWASTATIPPGLSIVADANQDTIADRIDDALCNSLNLKSGKSCCKCKAPS